MTLVTGVRSRTFYGRSKQVKSIHSSFFHGIGGRNGTFYPSEENAYLTNDVRDSLEVVRSGVVVPPVTIPASQLVCVSEVKEVLQDYPSVEFLPVKLIKVIDRWMAKGDLSYYNNEEVQDLEDEEYMMEFPDSRDRFPSLPLLWELLIPKVMDLESQFADLRECEFYFGEPDYGDSDEFNLSSSMFEVYPIVGLAGCTLFRDEIYRRIAHFFDDDFFCTCTREI